MKKLLFLAALAAGLAGCSSTPEPVKVEAPQTLFSEFQDMSAQLLESGGLSVVGIGESKSLELALNKAKINGRVDLAQLLETKIKTFRNDFVEETGLTEEAPILAQFSSAAQAITSQQIQGLAAAKLRYETIDGTVAAYALMELDPQAIMTQLEKEKVLYTRFRATKAFEALNQEIKEYEAFKAAQQM